MLINNFYALYEVEAVDLYGIFKRSSKRIAKCAFKCDEMPYNGVCTLVVSQLNRFSSHYEYRDILKHTRIWNKSVNTKGMLTQ